MSDFKIVFSYPLVLLLLIPALAFTLIPYFRLSKRYRKTRNRITSIVLHIIVMVLAISALAGMRFEYKIPNEKNEIILLVDMSDSEEEAQAARDEFVDIVLHDGQFDNYKIGVVTFGFDQKYAVPLTYDVDGIYDQYLDAELPDTSATNIAAALDYAKGLFENPQTAKIVLITDGKETDEEANKVIRSVAAQGIKVDTAYVPSDYVNDQVQLIGVEMPDYHVNLEENCTISVTLQSKDAFTAVIELRDNGVSSAVTPYQQVPLIKGTQTVAFTHSFSEYGLHEIVFNIQLDGDGLEKNNEYHSYIYMESFNKILILERTDGESLMLKNLLNDKDEYNIEIMNIASEELPMSADALREYDQVILNNIAYRDMPQDFDVLLEEYISEYGGGVFTVGGNDGDEANAYNRDDLYGTVYQQFLPVQAIDYTPPVGVFVIIDRSGSMGGEDAYGDSLLDWAKAGTVSCLDALDDRDYIGIMTLDTDYNVVLELTPRTQEAKILSAINSIETAEGNTIFSSAIDRAGQALRALKSVDKRHIIIVTDGQPGDKEEEYLEIIQNYYETDGITLSIVGINMAEGDSAYEAMKKATDLGHGRTIPARTTDLTLVMREELRAPEINEVNIPEEGFHPIVNLETSSLVQGLDRGEGAEKNKLTVTLDGFYGVKARSSDVADLILVGDYEVPIYAQWNYGKGRVGSFMCDLNGVFSADFMADPNGQQFIKNVVNNLMPVTNIRPNDISIKLTEDNYTNVLSVDAHLEEGETLKGELVAIVDGGEESLSLGETTPDTEDDPLSERAFYVKTCETDTLNQLNRVTFIAKKAGIYKIVVIKYNAQGVEVARLESYKAVSYSEEYDAFTDEATEGEEIVAPEEFLASLAERGNGVAIEDLEDPVEIFEGFVTDIDKEFDPRFVFMILLICLFLLDLAVRKFKFKWPHELIREYKEKKNFK